MKNLLANVNWSKVAEKAGYGATIAFAIIGAIADHNKENKIKQMEKDIATLMKGKS